MAKIKKPTREEKLAAAHADERAKLAAGMREVVARKRALRVYNERDAFMTEGDKPAQALFHMVHEFESVTADLRKRIERLVTELQESLTRLDSNRADPLQYSNPLAQPGSDIEQANAKRKTLISGIASLAYATGWHVPQICDTYATERFAKLVSVDVAREADDADGEVWRALVLGQDVRTFGLPGADALALPPYRSEEAAWLAVRAVLPIEFDYR